MANEFKVKNGLIVDQGGANITGSSFITGSLTVSSGITGSLFGSASYALTASYALNAGGASIDTGSFATTGSNRFIGNQIVTGSLTLSSSAEIELTVIGNQINTGSITATQGFTGSLFGTASWANNAATASYALNGGVTQLLAGSNVTLSPTNGLGQVTISSTGGGGSSFNTATGSYGSFYSTQTQTNVAGTARSMSLNVTDITNGVLVSGSTDPYNTYIKTENAGVYNIQFSAQVDKIDSGTDEIWIWIKKNGTNLTDTATSLQLVGNGAHYVAAWNFFVNAAAGDYFQLMWYSPDANVRLHSELAFGEVPGIPSLIVTANRIDQFLSNTGSFSGSFNGSLFGTASWANNATTASYVTSSGVFGPNGANSILSSSFALTASYVVQAISASFAATAAIAPNYVLTSVTSSMLAPYVLNSQTSSFVTNTQTSSFVLNSQTSSMSVATASYVLNAVSSSFAATAALAPNYVLNSVTASMLTPYVLSSSTSSMSVLSASFASTASSAENFTVRGTLTAQTIVVQTITSSVDFVTGSTRFGSASNSTHQFTGSVSVSGSLSVNSGVINSLTSSYAMTASYWSGSTLNSTSASYAATAALAPNYVLNSSTASFVINNQTGSFITNSQTASMSVLTSSYAGTASLAPSYVLNSSTSSMLLPYVLTSVTSSMLAPYVLSTNTSSFITNSQTSSMSVLSSSFASTSSFVNTLNQNVIITGVLSVATGSIGPNENTITLGARDSANEGGQIGFNAPGGTYTSASFIDNWSNYIRILRGTNATSTGLVAQWNLHTLQMELPGYTNASSFVGTATANLAVDSSGKVITVSTTGGSVFPYTGNAVITGSLTVTQPIYVPINGGMYFQGGDDAALYDINVVNTLGVYGVQDSTIASIKIGSGGGTISGRSGNIGVGTINPGATLHVQGNVSASSFTGSLFGTSSWSDNSRSASYAATASFAPSYVLNSSTSSFVTNSQTGSFITNSQTSSMTVLSASFAATTSLAPNYVLNSSTSSMLTPYVLTSVTASMLSPYVLSSNTGSFVTNSQTSSMSVATASYVLNAISSSYAATAALAPNYVLNSSTSSMLLPYVLTSVTSSMLSPYVLSSNTGSFITNSQTASMTVLSSSFASTASSAENFTVRGTLTAQTIVVQTITSSVDFVTGSSRFGSLQTNTHQFTGSVSVTGSLRQTYGSNYIDIFSNVNGSSPYIDLFYSGVQGARLNSYASVGGSFVNTSGYLLGDTSGNPLDVKVKSLYAANGIEVKGASSAAIWLSSAADNRIQFFQPSIAYRGNIGVASGTSYIQIRTGQATNFSDGTLNTIFDEAGSVGIGGITSVSASAKLQVDSITKGVLLTRTDLTSNISLPAQGLITYLTGSTNEGLWYYSSGSIKSWTKLLNDTGSQSISGSLTVTQGITGSLQGTSSWANNSISSSYITASNVIGNVTSASYAVSSSFALSASYAKNSPITIADEGTVQGTVTFLNFIGSAVTATVSSNTGSITITGGSGGGLATKSGAVTNTTFTGTPRKATVTFSAAFPNTSYGIVVTGADLRSWTIESKVAGSFIINTNSNAALTGDTYWVATAYGETA